MATQRQLGAPPSRSVFVGRQGELGALEEALEDARSGQPRVVLIEGPAGIGKTALVERFLAGAREVNVLRASGDVSESDLGFGVVDQLLRRAGEVPASVLLDGSDHVAAGVRILELLGTLQDEHPVAFVLDDAHWADLLSLRALLFVVRRLVADRVLVVIATREDAPMLPEGLIKAAAEPAGRRLRLRPLGTDELRALARAQGVELSAGAVQRLEAHAGGNPLYTRALLDELPADAWHRQDNLPAPRSFAAIVRRRAAACSPDVFRLLEAVAVLGPHCPVATSASVGEVESPLEALDEATAAGLLRWDETPGVPAPAFAHPLIAAALYDQMPAARRAQLHAAAAAVVEDEGASLRHLAAAAPGPDGELALRLEALAEQKAASHSLPSAALAMVAAARLSPAREEREERLLRAVDWLLVAGDAAQARAFAEQIAGFAEGPRRSSIQGQLAELEGHVDEAARLLAAAWEHCDPEAEPVLAAMIAHRNAYHSLRSLRDHDVVTWARRALSLAPDDRLAVGWASTLALSLWRLGRGEEAFAVLESAWTGDENIDLHVRGQRGSLLFAEDDIKAARADLEAAAAGELRLGALVFSSIRLTVLSRLHYAMGDWADAVVAAEQALALASEAEHPHSAFVWWAVIAVPAARGDWTTADVYARKAAAEPIDATDRAVAVGMALALVAAARGDAAAVLAALDPVAALSPNPGIDEPGFWPWQDLFAEALVGVGRTEEADAFLRPHEALAEQRGRPSIIARLARVRGRAEAARGRREPAIAAFKRALGHIEPLGMPYEEALIRYAHGQFLRRNGRRRAAAEELNRARDALVELGARPALERCDRELEACGLKPVKRGASERPDLTPQEQAVARLVATGLTNREVAGELLLSVKTVEVHLTHVYAKLGVSSRSQLAAKATAAP
jgi:DNA-binding CsgD family transcriptional regulator/tetratricopeptide (TPR) repeat protein